MGKLRSGLIVTPVKKITLKIFSQIR